MSSRWRRFWPGFPEPPSRRPTYLCGSGLAHTSPPSSPRGAGLVAARTRELPRKVAVLLGLIVPLLIGGGELAWWGRTPPSAAVLAVGTGQAILLACSCWATEDDGG